MATYPVVNTKTGEQKEVMMSIMEWDQWCKDNPDWHKDWQAGCASMSTEFRWTGEAKSSGWNEVLDRASKQPGATVRKNRDYSF